MRILTRKCRKWLFYSALIAIGYWILYPFIYSANDRRKTSSARAHDDQVMIYRQARFDNYTRSEHSRTGMMTFWGPDRCDIDSHACTATSSNHMYIHSYIYFISCSIYMIYLGLASCTRA